MVQSCMATDSDSIAAFSASQSCQTELGYTTRNLYKIPFKNLYYAIVYKVPILSNVCVLL